MQIGMKTIPGSTFPKLDFSTSLADAKPQAKTELAQSVAPLPEGVTRRVDEAGRPTYSVILPDTTARDLLTPGWGQRLHDLPIKGFSIISPNPEYGSPSLSIQLRIPQSYDFNTQLEPEDLSPPGVARAVVSSLGGIDEAERVIDQLAAESAAATGQEPPGAEPLKQKLRGYLARDEADFELQGREPRDRAERIVKRSRALEEGPDLTPMLNQIGLDYGIPGGARPWTVWMDEAAEVPVVRTILDASSRFKDVSPEALSTVMFGEGAGFFDVDRMRSSDWQAWNNKSRSGYAYYGLDHFSDMAPELKKREYLPNNFTYEPEVRVNELGKNVTSAKFATFEDTVLASAATWQYAMDQTKSILQEKFGSLPTDDETTFYYAYALFNGGPGVARQMMDARGLNYKPQWSGPPPEDDSLGVTPYNALVRTAQLEFFKRSGVFDR